MARRIRWVYLIGSREVRPVKIGSSFDPDERLSDLQVGSPVMLELLWKTRGSHALDKSLQEYFEPYRIHGGWFDFHDENPLPLVVAAAALMGFWTRPERVSADPRFTCRSDRREKWLADHSEESAPGAPPPEMPPAPDLGPVFWSEPPVPPGTALTD